MKQKYPVTWRLTIPGTRYWTRVLIFEDRKQMEAFWVQWPKRFLKLAQLGSFNALCVGSSARGAFPATYQIGFLIFNRGYFGGGVVAHELSHLADALFVKHKLPGFGKWLGRDLGERRAKTMEHLTIRFWRGYYKRLKK